MQLTSSAFGDGKPIPAKYTCQGDNVSPPLTITDVPTGAQSLVLICDDPDAATDPNGPGGTFDHWVIYDIAPDATEIAEDSIPPEGIQGVNGKSEARYTGPCPPTGQHRYFFKLYALDTALGLAPGATTEEVESALAGHVMAQTELIGTYEQS